LAPKDDDEFGTLPTGSDDPTSRLSDEELYGPDAPPTVVPSPELPRSADRIPAKYRKSAGASLLAAGLLGLRDILEPPKDDRPVVEQHADDDQPERPIELYLDPDDPSRSTVVIRNPADDN